MDNASIAPEKNLIKLLLIGDGKVGKSYFAGSAAAAGFHVLYIDGDVATPTLMQLDAKAKKNIFLLGCHDTILGGARDHRFINLMTEFTSTITFKWNDTQGRLAKPSDKTDEIWQIFPAKMDQNCILILDSWTSLVESIMLKAAIANSVNLQDATTNEMRPVYQSSANIATALLQVIRALPCHCIVIGHPDEYQHKVSPDGRKVGDVKEKGLVIEWTKMIAKSTSRPQALQMPKYFTDVAWMETSPTGTRKLDFRVKASRVSGGHFSGFEDTDKYSFANLIKEIGGKVPDGSQPFDHWLKILTPEEAAATPENKVLEGGNAGKVVGIAGIAGLGKKAANA
jgi:hypothetical protein